MINDVKRGNLATSLAFHDFKNNKINWTEWFRYIEEWFYKNGVVPNRINGSSRKTIQFENGKKRLEKNSYTTIEEDGIWIVATPPEVGTEMLDYILAVDIHGSAGRKSMVLSWDDQICKFNREYLEAIAVDLYELMKPAYGYVFQRLFKHGPNFYPFGVISGLDFGRPERKQIMKWGDEYKGIDGKYRTGLLRDIYPINFLSNPHFEQKIDGVPLKDWIESSADHGELKQLQDNFWSWWVPEENIATVREHLLKEELLLAY